MCDLNTASVDEMSALPRMTRDQAMQLQLWRPFRSWEDVAAASGLDERAVARLRKAGARIDPVDLGEPRLASLSKYG